MNATIVKFGYPATLLREFDHWVVLLRPAQPTLGALVVAAKSDALAFHDLSAAAFAELTVVTAVVERALHRAVAYERINWLMLMMADPHVHFHVLPRYEGTREHVGLTVADAGWPGVPDLAQAVKLDDTQLAATATWLQGYFAA